MYRKDSIIIEEWLKRSDKALLVTGARQIGKTWLIREEIAKSGYCKFEVNFIDQPDLVDYLNVKMSANEFLVKLKMIMPEDCKPQETVVFFDEIQKCPEIVTKIKFLVEEGSFKYVMSGSLLGVELKGITSVPVGYLTVLRMYPMDFEEFMIANQVSVATLDMLEEKWKASAPVIPLLASKSSNVFRLFSSDIGLLTSAYPAETKMELINKNGEVNNGAHFENVIAQQLTANGFTPYFCKKKNIGEMDFAIEMNGKVVPIEVKSGKAYRSHKALDHFMKVADYHLEKAYVFSVGNVEVDGVITYLPIYMCYLLKEKRIGQMIVDLDMTGL